MYYIIETKYVGPNPHAEGADVNRVEISLSPTVTNSSGEVRIKGWCGVTNDWAVYAHGEYETLDAAVTAIAEIFGDVRDADANGDKFESDDEYAVRVYKPGKFIPMSRENAGNWIFDAAQKEIDASWTDKELLALDKRLEDEANAEGYTLPSIFDMLVDWRDECKHYGG